MAIGGARRRDDPSDASVTMRLFWRTMRSVALALLALGACDGPSPTLELDAIGCAAIVLDVRDEILPGWEITGLAAEQSGGDTAWVLGADPEGRVRLMPWPTGPGVELSALGEIGDFRLLPGPVDSESWLVLERPGKIRVWRLGEAARGEIIEVPGLAHLPPEPDWTLRLVFIGGGPFLVAVPRRLPASGLILQVAGIHPRTLALGEFHQLDAQTVFFAEAKLVKDPFGGLVEILDVNEAGRIPGAALLLGIRDTGSLVDEGPPGHLRAPGPRGYDPVYTVVELLDTGPEGTIELRRWPNVGDLVGRPEYGMRGQIAVGARSIFTLTWAVDGPEREHYNFTVIGREDTRFEADDFDSDSKSNSLLQLGAHPMLGQFEAGRWVPRPLQEEASRPSIAGLELARGAQVTSAGHEQLLVRPVAGPALRVVASCAPGP